MRGGKRKGSGRPKLEPTKVVRVPMGCLKDVTEIINRHRMKSVMEIKDSSMKPVTKTKDTTMKSVTEIKNSSMKPVTEIKDTTMKSVTAIKNKPIPKKFKKWYNRRNDPVRDGVRKEIKDVYGSLQGAVNAGVRLTGNNLHFPD